MEPKERIQEINNGQCTHYWLIDGSNVGRCIRCGDVRDFGALMKREVVDIFEPAWRRGGKRGRPSKRQLLVGAMIEDATERNGESDDNSSYSD